jgi:hypothetical protein
MKRWISLWTMCLGLISPGCMVGVDHGHGSGGYYDDALLTVEWRVDGSTHPDACWDYGAEYAYITVESRSGVEESRVVSCDAFSYDFYLPAGRYWVTISLQDGRHDDITSVIETDSRTLYDGESSYIVAEFPDSSFL